ncbi:CPBP family intramembrane glutamic endopeptidase [Chryseolinea soli]|uniref:CPBP family intramembrane metalloprotease n=1 Tax=Chryseolinea soli TaxID=2321403 RepID=A0A385SWX6_9BACT|nr:CPBP family intramembrane glutamic endopeptidase [Chryseolinea soli]AYB34210.1 CPBP family intramembrane metalloprotease [Chryseolinea soli]
MKKIWKFLVHHVKEDFNARSYGLIFLFLAASVYVNYRFDFEDTYLDTQKGFIKFFAYFLFYGFAYFSALLILYFSRKGNTFLKNRDFWIRSLLAIGLLSLDGSQPFLHEAINASFSVQVQYWTYKVLTNLAGLFFVTIPLLAFHHYYDRRENYYYGLRPHQFDTRPYFQLLLLMMPLIIGASFNDGFLRQYPMYKVTQAYTVLGVPEWVTVGIYEAVYGMDFVNVELLFRGFLVIGMIAVLGRQAVLAMAVTYCYLHFGKPAGEAISSIFGGYILGVVAFETRSIWGGIIVHMGIAWSMELVAFIQKSL